MALKEIKSHEKGFPYHGCKEIFCNFPESHRELGTHNLLGNLNVM
jgi:hypothetical protein